MKEMLSDKENVALLWTGGWDSTFQLLQLLIIHRRRVTPFYLLDEERRSTGVEIRTIKRIKGLEFRAVALACADPNDPMNSLEEADALSRCERYVASTRAREHLLVTLALK